MVYGPNCAPVREGIFPATSTLSNTLALLPSVKRQIFCVGNRLTIVKHKAWATTIVAPKSVRSMTTKEQMKPASQ